jgi:ATP-binding cassette, subfamily C, type I secretion system permease/ATPase
VTGGAMIASSILMGRALAPVEQLMGQWAVLQRARSGFLSLAQLLSITPPLPPRTGLPAPRAHLAVSALSILPPGAKKATVLNVSFELQPGQALGVIGNSGSGKSTLAKALLNLWPAAAGEIRFSDATLEQYESDELGRKIGYLPQTVTLFNGTVAENIARMSIDVDSEAVVAAATRANAHQMITGLADGYDTRLEGSNSQLSGGQKQRIALARALYGDPELLILDEPNSALDAEGSNALNACVREFKRAGKSVILMTHRPSAISECELLMVMDAGRVTAFGPRNEVIKSMLQNADDVRKVVKQAAVS